jgi:hypothetical protein
MKKKWESQEAVDLATGVINQLMAVPNTGLLTYTGGVLLAALPLQIFTGTITQPSGGLTDVFEQARLAGLPYSQFDIIRTRVSAMLPTGASAQALQAFIINLCLIEQAQVLAATVFTIRADIDSALDKINLAFSAGIETASNNFDHEVYSALVSLNAACAQDLSTRAQSLPRMVQFTFPVALPSLYLAQRIYGDASRADELAAENPAPHPLFITSPIFALSA